MAEKDKMIIEIEAIINNSILKQTDEILGAVEKKAKKTEKSINDLGGAFQKMGTLVAAYLSVNKIKDGIDLASDFTENRNKLESVFKGQTADMDEFINDISDRLNLGKRQLEKEVADVGGMLAGMGFESDDLTYNTETTLKAAKDLASFYNLDLNDSIKMLTAGLTGETEALKRQGIIINDTAMEEYAEQYGKAWKDLDNTAKAQLRLNAAVDKMKLAGAAGDAIKTKNEYAGVEKSIKSLSETIFGDFFMSFKEALLPSMTKTRDFLKENQKEIIAFGAKIGDFISEVLDAAGGIADFIMENKSLVKSVGIAIGVMYGLSTAIGIVNAVMTANPIGLVVAAIGALVAGMVYAYQESETFRDIADSTFQLLKSAAEVVFPIVETYFKTMISLLKKVGEFMGNVFGKIKEGWEWLSNSKAGKFVAKLFSSGDKNINLNLNEDQEKKIKSQVNAISPPIMLSNNQKSVEEKTKEIIEKENKTKEKETYTENREILKTSRNTLEINLNVQSTVIELKERLEKVVRDEIEAYEREQLINVGLT